MTGWLRSWAWRLGLHPTAPGRGVVVWGDTPEADLGELLRRIREAHPRVNVFQVRAETTHGRTGTVALPEPAPFDWATRRFLRRLKVQAIVVVPDAPLPDRLRGIAADQGIGILRLGGASGVDAVFDRLGPLLATARPPAKAAPGLEARLLARLDRAPLAWVTTRKFSAVSSLAELGEALGHPQTILCLGNGPSSEDPSLDALAYDALFRVNHVWLAGARHTEPDVIFTGKKDTLSAYRGPTLFAFQTEQAARRIMLRSILIPRRIRYCTAETLGCIDFAAFAPYKPTNGAVMMALAAALAPQRLVIAGMDLFSDPRGSYPGRSATPNAYAAAHDRDVEARSILATMAAFSGELIVVGDVLRARWAEYQSGARGPAPNH